MKPRKASYESFEPKNLILRDHLAADRTILANERTILAYIRTVLTAFVAGLTILKFFTGIYYEIIAWILIALGFIISGVGIWRCRENHRFLAKFLKK